MADPVSLGITIALTAAQMAFTASQVHEGPRLTDLKATVADYGTPLNYVHGTRRVQCPAFYAEPIVEKKKKRKGKGGKQVSYTGFGTFAVHLADHPIAALRRVYFDNHLVYDVTGSGDAVFPLADDYELTAYMRIYDGSQTQADPRMLASVEAKKGPGTCPAYLDTSYIFFEDVPLEQIGNRFPQVRAEFVAGGSDGLFLVPEGAELELSWLQGTFEQTTNDQARMGIGFVAPNGSLIGSINWASLIDTTPSMTFVARSVSATVPANCVRIRLYMEMVRRSGSNNDGYIDAVALTMNGAPVPIANPGAESGGTAGWTVTAGGLGVRDASPAPASGDWYFTGGSSATTRAHQDITSVVAGSVLLGQILADVAAFCGLAPSECDFSALDQEVQGYSWTQGSARQIIEPLLALHDSDLRPHDFMLVGLKRGSAPAGDVLADSEFAAGETPGKHYTLRTTADTDLPQRLALTFADVDSEQQPNTAVVQRSAAAMSSARDQQLDFTTVAMDASEARDLLLRYHRRQWFARTSADFGLTRRRIAIEPGDVRSATFADEVATLYCTKMTLGADGVLACEWDQDDPALAALAGAAGAPAAGHVPSEIYNPSDTTGAVLDLPLLTDAHDQTAPFAYLAAAPSDDEFVWPGADFATSDTGELDSYTEGWGGVSGAQAAVFGTVAEQLGDVDPFVMDNGSSLTVTIESGTLAGAAVDDLLTDGTRNLALIGDELVQFSSATLTAPLTYTLTGFLRGVRGTEAAVGGHAADERFVLLDGAAVVRTLGASEIGDTDWYIASSVGRTPDQDTAESLAFTAAAHRPYSPVNGVLAQSGGDWTVDGIRRTRIGGASLNGQDVPLGEASEAWEVDVMDGATVVRTLTGTSLPLIYTEADQITDWGGTQSSLTVRLFQMNPTLNLRGFPLEIST